MASFAELNDNIVVRIVEVNDVVLINENGVEQESIGINFCQNLFGGGTWIQTFVDGKRKRFGEVGYTYDPVNDVFIAPQPYPSWTLDLNYDWQPPVSRPQEGSWKWNEDSQKWDVGFQPTA